MDFTRIEDSNQYQDQANQLDTSLGQMTDYCEIDENMTVQSQTQEPEHSGHDETKNEKENATKHGTRTEENTDAGSMSGSEISLPVAKDASARKSNEQNRTSAISHEVEGNGQDQLSTESQILLTIDTNDSDLPMECSTSLNNDSPNCASELRKSGNGDDDAIEKWSNDTECNPIILNVRGNATDEEVSVVQTDEGSTTIHKVCEKSHCVENIDASEKPCSTQSSSLICNTVVDKTTFNSTPEISRDSGQLHISSIIGINVSQESMTSCEKSKDSSTNVVSDKSPSAASLLQTMISKTIAGKAFNSLSSVNNHTVWQTNTVPKSVKQNVTKIVTSVVQRRNSSTSKLISILPSTSSSQKNRAPKNSDSGVAASTKSALRVVLTGSGHVAQMNSKQVSSNMGSSMETDSDNSNDEGESCYQSVVEKIFSCASKQEGIGRKDALQTKLLQPLRKVRENLDKAFVCSICGDEFYSEQFLKHHLARKVFVMTYCCEHCRAILVFNNKCEFWQHVKKEQGHIDLRKFENESGYFNLKPHAPMDLVEKYQSKCQNCCKKFSSADEANRHYNRIETSQPVSNCHECFMSLANKCGLFAHRTIHEAASKDVICPECGITIPQSDGLKVLFDHLDSCHHFNFGYIIPCRCGKYFTSVEGIKLHLMDSHTKLLFHCHVCKSCFSQYHLLSSHCQTMHSVSSLPSKVVLCTICNQGFQNHLKLKSHIEKHAHDLIAARKKALLCFICKKAFNATHSLNEHVEKEHTHKPKRCTICFGLFESRQNLVQHIVSKSCSSDNLPKKLHECIDQPSKQEKEVNIMSYKQLFESSVITPSAGTTVSVSMAKNLNKMKTFRRPLIVKPTHSTDKKKFQCHSCKICLIGSHNYAKHQGLHKLNGIMRNQTYCGICKKTVHDSLIQSHMENHQKRGIIVCSLCHSRNFNTMHDALQHSKNFCNYAQVENDGAFYINNNKSKRVNDADNIEVIAIDGQSNVEEEAQLLEADTIGEENSSASVFPCLMCGLAFTSRQAKEDHVSRVHDGTRIMYFCLLCKKKGIQKRFTKKNLISKHICHKHRIVDPNTIASLIHMEEQNVTSGRVIPTELDDHCSAAPPPKRLRLATEGDYICGKCGFSSSDSEIFGDHIITHNPKKEPQCPECGLCFTVLSALKKHLFVVHRIKAMNKYLEEKGLLETEEEEEEDEIEWDETVDIDSPAASCMDNSFGKEKSQQDCVLDKVTKSVDRNLYECNVCYREFSSEAVLKSHMRNHGMAFIRSKRHNKTSN